MSDLDKERAGEETPEGNEAQADVFSYPEARERLATVSFDLDVAKRAYVKEKIRWDWILPDSAESQEKLLEKETRISPRALQEIMRAIQEGKKFQLIFSFEGYAPMLGWDPISAHNPTNLLQREFFRAADQLGFLQQDYRTWRSDEKLLKTFSQPERGGGITEDSAIIFTPDDREVPPELMGKSPNEWSTITQDQKESLHAAGIFLKPDIELLRPLEWIEFSLRSIDNGLRTLHTDRAIDTMDPVTFRRFRREVIRNDRRIDEYFPNTRTVTLFPHWRRIEPDFSIEDSPALGLKWEINNGTARIVVISYEPNQESVDAGPRRSFGRRRRSPPSFFPG